MKQKKNIVQYSRRFCVEVKRLPLAQRGASIRVFVDATGKRMAPLMCPFTAAFAE